LRERSLRERLFAPMKGRALLIALASICVAATPAQNSAAGRGAGSGSPAGEGNLPIGCGHGGPRFRTHGPRGRKRIAIGFDDGPSDDTLSILRVLREFHAHATFFEIGQEVPGRSAVMKKVLGQGSEIGNHSLHHEINPSTASLHETNRLIRNATGFRPCDFRPPDGRVNSGLIARAHAERMVTVNWDVDARDWANPGVGAIVSNVIAHARSGSIVVMHDAPSGSRGETIAALPSILTHCRHRGYEFVTVAELLGHKFIYPPNS
jgi:peptidoglycan/xylan/chitin deacetylase (PgdA/CDA1 family)